MRHFDEIDRAEDTRGQKRFLRFLVEISEEQGTETAALGDHGQAARVPGGRCAGWVPFLWRPDHSPAQLADHPRHPCCPV